MAVDMFLKLGDIKGESLDSKHKDEIQLHSWSWGMSQTGTTHNGPGGGAGKVSVSDLTITKNTDLASPALMLACCTGKHYKEALLTVRKAGEKPLEYFKLTLKDIIVTNYSPAGAQGDAQLAEHLSLNFAEFKVEYTPQKPDGSGGASVEASYHIAQNTKV